MILVDDSRKVKRHRTGAKKKPVPEASLSIEQIEQQYKDEWVLVEETAWDKNDMPKAGRVIAHSRDDEEVVETGVQYGKKQPRARLYFFYTGEKIPEGCVLLL